jgi:hypothetical protein
LQYFIRVFLTYLEFGARDVFEANDLSKLSAKDGLVERECLFGISIEVNVGVDGWHDFIVEIALFFSNSFAPKNRSEDGLCLSEEFFCKEGALGEIVAIFTQKTHVVVVISTSLPCCHHSDANDADDGAPYLFFC